MFAVILLAAFVLVANESKGELSSCDEQHYLLQKKTRAYHTVCLGKVSLASSDCCQNLEKRVEKQCKAFNELCPVRSKSLTGGMFSNVRLDFKCCTSYSDRNQYVCFYKTRRFRRP